MLHEFDISHMTTLSQDMGMTRHERVRGVNDHLASSSGHTTASCFARVDTQKMPTNMMPNVVNDGRHEHVFSYFAPMAASHKWKHAEVRLSSAS